MGSVIAPHCRFLPLLVALLLFDGFTALRNSDGRYVLACPLCCFHSYIMAPESADGLSSCVPPAKAEEAEKANAVVMSGDDLFIVEPYDLALCVIEGLRVKRCTNTR